jgi:hypothetical protein
MKSYEKDYEETMAALETALHKRDKIDVEIQSLGERVKALETLIRADYPHKGRHVIDQNTTPAQAIVNLIQPTVTERVRGLLIAANVPLTSAEIYEKLKQVGETLNPKTNPWALIHGICRRLVDQQFAREVEKDGRKAWVVAKHP